MQRSYVKFWFKDGGMKSDAPHPHFSSWKASESNEGSENTTLSLVKLGVAKFSIPRNFTAAFIYYLRRSYAYKVTYELRHKRYYV